jgi:hypothetical protein
MAAAGIDMICRSPDEWRVQIERLIGASAKEISGIGARGRQHALRAYSTEAFQARFDAVFEAVGFNPS